MSVLAFYAQFVKSLVGVNSLTVTWDVEQITRSDGTRSALVTGGATSITIGRRGLYGYLLASADTKLYDYVATAITAGDVDQKEIAALWTMYEADGLKLAGQTVTAAAGVTFPSSIASPTNITGGQINSVTGSVGSVANAETIADEVLKRDWTAVTGEASRSLLNALRFLRNKWSISGTTLTVTEEDDSTPAWTATLTSDAAADPVTGSDPI
jgi:hypothetical protein